MESKRQQKVSQLLQRDLAEIFQIDMRGQFSQNGMITVTKVNITKDLSVAKAYLSLFAVSDKEAFLGEIKEKTSMIRGLLGKRIRHQLRITPELLFYLDDSLDYIENIEKLVNE
jgi:ribosome-binding factor A